MPEKSTKQKSLKDSYLKLTALVNRIPKDIYFIIILFLLTRIVLTSSGLLSRQILKDVYKNWYEWRYDDQQWLDVWSVWDSGWYLDIAENGYSPTLQSNLPKKTCCGQSNIVFFPLYSMSIQFFGKIIGDFHLSGILISNMSFLIGSIYFYKLVSKMFNKQIAKKAVLFLYLFPTSYFFSAILTEGLFFLNAVLSFYFAYKEKWFTSSIFAFFSALTRSIGVFITVPLLISYLYKKIKAKKKIDNKILFFGLVLLAPVGVAFFMHQLTGNLISTFLVEKNSWGHGFTNPILYLIEIVLSKNAVLLYFLLLFVFEFLLIMINYKKLGPSLTSFSIIFLLLPLFSGGETILALPRFASVVFPIYISLALSIKSKLSIAIFSTIFLSLQFVSMFFWSIGIFGY